MSQVLTVCLITYNHEKYIAQAIESILMQKTTFDWELVIADDCSKDATRDIILKYKEQNPNKIKLIFQEKNVGPAQNFIDLITSPRSKYIAYLEGDDYWTDEFKLQKQVDVIIKNKDCVIVYHNSKLIDSDNKTLLESYLTEFYKKNYTELELMQGAHIISGTILFKNVLTIFPDEYINAFNGDTFFISLLGNFGNGIYLDESMSNYRKHENGVWNQYNEIKKYENSLESYKLMRNYYSRLENKNLVQYFENQIKLFNFFIKKSKCKKSNDYSCLLFKLKENLKVLKKAIKKYIKEYFLK